MPDLLQLHWIEKIFSYLSLKDLFRLRSVSRSWRKSVDSFKVKSLFYSERRSECIVGRSRLVSGAFAQNFISSSRFEPFFAVFGQSIFSKLKRLRLCEINLNLVNRSVFAQLLGSFGQLEELGFFATCNLAGELKLNLPSLKRIQIDAVAFMKLTLDAPKLRTIQFLSCDIYQRLIIVYPESVERLIVTGINQIAKKLTNLKYLYTNDRLRIDSTFLSDLEQLKEIHLEHRQIVMQLFEQKQLYGRTELKIYYCGCLLNSAQDPTIHSLSDYFDEVTLDYLAKNPYRLADEIPLREWFSCSTIERSTLASDRNLLKRFTGWKGIRVDRPILDIQCFLELLKNCDHIAELSFYGEHSQYLFDRLPEFCAVQKLTIFDAPADLDFLCELKHLVELTVSSPANVEYIRKLLEQLPFLLSLQLYYPGKAFEIKIVGLNQFKVRSKSGKLASFYNLKSVIQHIVKNTSIV